MVSNSRQQYETMSRQMEPGTVLGPNSGPMNRRLQEQQRYQPPPPQHIQQQERIQNENSQAVRNIVLPMNYNGPIPPPLHVLQKIAPDLAQSLQHASYVDQQGHSQNYGTLQQQEQPVNWQNGGPDPRYQQQAPPDPRYQQQAPPDPRYQQAPPDPRYQQAPPDPRYQQSFPDQRFQQSQNLNPAQLGYGQGPSARYGAPPPLQHSMSPHPGQVNPFSQRTGPPGVNAPSPPSEPQPYNSIGGGQSYQV
jgi:hypothetical protein